MSAPSGRNPNGQCSSPLAALMAIAQGRRSSRMGYASESERPRNSASRTAIHKPSGESKATIRSPSDAPRDRPLRRRINRNVTAAATGMIAADSFVNSAAARKIAAVRHCSLSVNSNAIPAKTAANMSKE